MLEEELDGFLARPRYGRRKSDDNDAPAPVAGCRHGHRQRALTGTFSKMEIAVPRARLMGEDGKTREWKSTFLRAYQRRTKAADALIAAPIFRGPTRAGCAARCKRYSRARWARMSSAGPGARSRAIGTPGTSARFPKSRSSSSFSTEPSCATSISLSLLVALGVRANGQKVLLAAKNMGGESESADGAPGLEKALAALQSDVLVRRCNVHKHRNLLAHAPERLHEEISNDYRDMIYTETKQEIEAKRKAFVRKAN